MRACTSVCLKLIALLFAALFVVAATLALLAINAERIVFDQQAYIQAFRQQNIYTRLPELASDQIIYYLDNDSPGLPAFLRQLSASDWQIVFTTLLPADWLGQTAESLIEQLFAYLDGKGDHLSLKISLVELKTLMVGESGLAAIRRISNLKPACSPEQLAVIARAAINQQWEQIPLCNPPEALIAQYHQQIQATLQQLAAQLPDETDLAQPTTHNTPATPGQDFRANLNRLRGYIRLSPFLAVALLALVTAFGVRSAHGWLRWWGIPLLIAGLLALSLALAVMPGVNWFLATYLAPRLDSLPLAPSIVQVLLDSLTALARPIALQTGAEGVGLALLGGMLTGLSFTVK